MSIRQISPLTPAFRHAQTPDIGDIGAGPPMFYEWWYFELEFLDTEGRPFRIITSFHYPHALDSHRVTANARFRNHASRYGGNPRHYAGIATYVVDMERSENVALCISRFARNQITAKVKLSRSGPVDLRFGASSFREFDAGKYQLVVEHTGRQQKAGRAPLRVQVVATFEQNTPGFEPPGGVLLSAAGKTHHWACVMPNPVVRIENVNVRRLQGRKWLRVCKADVGAGTLGGYHDHQWGDDLFWKQMARWSWGRVPLTRSSAGAKIVFFDVVPVGGVPRPAPVLVHAPAGTSMPQAMTPVTGQTPFLVGKAWDRIDHRDGCRLALRGRRIGYPRTLMIRARDAQGVVRHLDVHHSLGNNVDVWPFYLRFVPEVKVGATAVSAISEFMRADRLDDPPTLRALTASNMITTTAT
jgi:hypothetical protein